MIGRHVFYESRLALDRLWLTDFDSDVDSLATQPMWLCGPAARAYTRQHGEGQSGHQRMDLPLRAEDQRHFYGAIGQATLETVDLSTGHVKQDWP